MKSIVSFGPHFKSSPPISREEISTHEVRIGRQLPASYVEFLLQSNGGEGPVGESGYIMLWQIQNLENEQESRLRLGCHKNFLPIGSNGGGETLAIRFEPDDSSIGYLPEMEPVPSNYILIARDFWSALAKIGEGKAFE